MAAVATATLHDGESLVVDVATALLAGFMTYQVFHDELPDDRSMRIAWFLTGVAVTMGFHLLVG